MGRVSAEVIFNKFEIIQTLKKDEYTSVYLANHIYLGKKIILKTLNTDGLNDKTILDRFKREAQILARLDHPNLIKVLDFGTYLNFFYISFEYFEGNNLKKTIHNNRISEKEKTFLVIQLFKALNIAHQNQVIHRDIKPENILVNSNLHLKIADFGLALVKSDNTLTQKSSIVGTPGYMSPEQIRGDVLTQQTDLFSAGIVTYELFTGKNPFVGKEINETINNILSFNAEKDLPGLSSLPENIRNLILNLLRKNFSKRIKTAFEALSILGVEGEVYKPVLSELSKKPSKRKKSLIYSSLSVLLLSLLIGLWYTTENKNESKNRIQPVSDENKLNTDKKNTVSEDTSSAKPLDIAEVEKTNEEENTIPPEMINGRIFVEVIPWAEVYINNKKFDTTPLKRYIRLKPGKYNLKLVHPDYPPYNQEIEVLPADIQNIKVDFNDYIGYLNCEIYPWGEVSVDGDYIGVTPLREAIPLSPGEHSIIVSNPVFGEIKEEVIIIAGETLAYRLDFESKEQIKEPMEGK